MQKTFKMTETLANGYSYESGQRELSNAYQHDRVQMVFKIFCIFVLWTKVALALKGLSHYRHRLVDMYCPVVLSCPSEVRVIKMDLEKGQSIAEIAVDFDYIGSGPQVNGIDLSENQLIKHVIS